MNLSLTPNRTPLLLAFGFSILTLPLCQVRAEDLTTQAGKTYRFVKVVRVEPEGVVIDHSTGRTRVAFAELSAPERAKVKGLPAAPTELPALVVTDKGGMQFQYNGGQSSTQPSVDLTRREMALQAEERRKQDEHKNAQTFFEQRWWDYLPIRLGSSDGRDDAFMTPNYLKPEFQGLSLKQEAASPQTNPFGLKW